MYCAYINTCMYYTSEMHCISQVLLTSSLETLILIKKMYMHRKPCCLRALLTSKIHHAKAQHRSSSTQDVCVSQTLPPTSTAHIECPSSPKLSTAHRQHKMYVYCTSSCLHAQLTSKMCHAKAQHLTVEKWGTHTSQIPISAGAPIPQVYHAKAQHPAFVEWKICM